MKQLDVYLDLGNIAGYAALSGTLQLIEETQVTARWLPIRSIIPRPISREPRADSATDPLFEYKQKRYAAKRQFELDELSRDCQRLCLDPGLAEQNVDGTLTHVACIALLDLGQPPLPFMQAVYDLRLKQGKQLLDNASVGELVEKFGVDDFLDGLPQYQDHWEQHVRQYLELGIHDTPSFVLEGETFQGRQHLPLMQWRLKGEVGPPPL